MTDIEINVFAAKVSPEAAAFAYGYESAKRKYQGEGMNQKEQIKDAYEAGYMRGHHDTVESNGVNPGTAASEYVDTLTAPQPQASDREIAEKTIRVVLDACEVTQAYDSPDEPYFIDYSKTYLENQMLDFIATLRADELRKAEAEIAAKDKRIAELEKECATPILVNTARLADQLSAEREKSERLRACVDAFCMAHDLPGDHCEYDQAYRIGKEALAATKPAAPSPDLRKPQYHLGQNVLARIGDGSYDEGTIAGVEVEYRYRVAFPPDGKFHGGEILGMGAAWTEDMLKPSRGNE